ncbi:MAG: DNA mismatch repair endonuclease MutL [Mogibacterium sp.]|nr:DNA mismatch repair endonuclease MutL [Mogibacterium sp.]
MIRILDRFVADKIAAGEVIERPLSIVKELVENSIDAGAGKIVAEIRNGGKSYIRVTDDGCGIPADEVAIAFERHATGKIATLSDLDHIETLGFRGEALASISAVSRLTIYTRTTDETIGTKAVLHGGRLVEKEAVGCNRGTTITCEDVFYNTPARRKFMKSDAAEASLIIDLIQKLAICYADIAFRMINNGNILLSTDGAGDRKRTIADVYNTPEFRNLIEIKNDTVEGFISDPGVTRSTRKGQIFFVNGRIVSSAAIEKGLALGYGDRIFSGYPVAVLFITADPSTLDVNIHPNKREIKFLNEADVVQAVADAVRSVMQSEAAVPSAVHRPSHGAQHGQTSYVDPSRARSESQIGIRDFLSVHENRLPVEPPAPAAVREPKPHPSDTRDSDARSIKISEPSDRPFDFADLVVKGYIFDAYIILQAGDVLYILDQHAAHERILYERLVGSYNAETHVSQPILTPFTVEVTADTYNSENQFLDALRGMGFGIDPFGANTYIIREIPPYMTLDEAANFAKDFIDSAPAGDAANQTVIDKLIMRSCKGAVKANDRLSDREIGDLIQTLSECRNPFSCPHGRPTFLRITKYQVEKAFKRK